MSIIDRRELGMTTSVRIGLYRKAGDGGGFHEFPCLTDVDKQPGLCHHQSATVNRVNRVNKWPRLSPYNQEIYESESLVIY